MPEVASKLILVDLDRTLTRPETAVIYLEEICRSMEIPVTKLEAAKFAVETAGGSFSPLRFLRQQNPAYDILTLERHFLSLAEPAALLYDDAAPLLDYLSASSLHFGIITYGETDWQELKMRAAGLIQYPYFITDQTDKGAIIASWKTDTGYDASFYTPGLITDSVFLVDDKAMSFKGFPTDCQGAWLQRSSEPALASQAGDIPSQVQKINSLALIPDLIAWP